MGLARLELRDRHCPRLAAGVCDTGKEHMLNHRSVNRRTHSTAKRYLANTALVNMPYVVLGGGVAGVACAQELCRVAPAADVVLVSASATVKGVRGQAVGSSGAA
jgi:heterodisulfide reductase subunit A-like polyferredoxin